jgi:hypothetical protein
MKKAVFIAVICSLLFIPDVAISGNMVTGNINLFIGTRTLEDEWSPADKQDELGIEADFKERGWPFSMAISFLRGSGEGDLWGQELKSETSELNVGLRKIWDSFPHTRPFIGGGIALIKCEFRGLGVSDDDNTVGTWIGAGIYWTLAEKLNIGFEGKISFAEATLFDSVNADAGGSHLGCLIGLHW